MVVRSRSLIADGPVQTRVLPVPVLARPPRQAHVVEPVPDVPLPVGQAAHVLPSTLYWLTGHAIVVMIAHARPSSVPIHVQAVVPQPTRTHRCRRG